MNMIGGIPILIQICFPFLSGVENPATLAHYYRGDWKLYRDELKK